VTKTGKGNTNRGLTLNMRHQSHDAIPFNLSIRSNIELWHWASVPVNLALTSYWYVQFPFECNTTPDVKSVQYPVAQSAGDFEE
jgi:hypothetical protein